MAQQTSEESKKFAAWFIKKAQAKGKNPEAYAKELGKEGMAKMWQEYNSSQQATKARYGAKLDFIKRISGDCPEGQELVFFKKGGRICKACQGKKFETGGQASLKNVVQQFKDLRKKNKLDEAARDSIEVNKYGNEDIPTNRPGDFKKNKRGVVQWTPDRTKSPYNKK